MKKHKDRKGKNKNEEDIKKGKDIFNKEDMYILETEEEKHVYCGWNGSDFYSLNGVESHNIDVMEDVSQKLTVLAVRVV